MKTKTMMTLALLAGTAACDGEAKFDEADTTDEPTAESSATFADAGEEEMISAFVVGSGMDLVMVGMLLHMLDGPSSCVVMTEVEGGLSYQASEQPGCADEMSGTVTVYGVEANGWTMEPVQGDVTIDFDSVEMAGGFDEGAPVYLNGTIDYGPTYLEADLQIENLGFGSTESHARVVVDHETGAMTHTAGSWGLVRGLGTFDAAGSVNLHTGEMDLSLAGEDSLSFRFSDEEPCISTKRDGEDVVLDSDVFLFCTD